MSTVTSDRSPLHKPETRRELIASLENRLSAPGVIRRKSRRLSGGLLFVVTTSLVRAAKRSLDGTVAALLLFALFPLIIALAWQAVRGKGGVVRSSCVGRWGVSFDRLSFRFNSSLDNTLLANIPLLINVLRGDMSLVGPRLLPPGSFGPTERSLWRRYNVRPGLFCLWWVRNRGNVAYASEVDIDGEYIDGQSLAGDFAIALRAIPAALYGAGTSFAPDRLHLLDIPIDNFTMDESIEYIASRTREAAPSQVCFVNADCVNIAFRVPEYRELLQRTNLVLGDGIGVKIACRLLNMNIRQNVNGTDLFPRLCAELERRQLGLFLLGGKPGIADDVVKWVRRNYPKLPICGFSHGYFKESEKEGILRQIEATAPHVLLVGFGAPKQDVWIHEHLEQLRVPVSIGVGGLFDFYSGRIPRAPQWMREIGLEWIYRFLQEPGRMWRRYLVGNAVFLFRVLQARKTQTTAEKSVDTQGMKS